MDTNNTTDEPIFVVDNNYIQHVDIALTDEYTDSGDMCILSDSEGNMKGSIHLFNQGYSSKSLNIRMRKQIQKAARSVCRLYIIYESICKKRIRLFGTAFFVSENLLMTSHNCINKFSHEYDGIIYYFKNVFIDSSNYSRNSQFEIEGDSYLIERVNIVNRNTYCTQSSSSKIPGKDIYWKTNNDFAFLEILNSSHSNFLTIEPLTIPTDINTCFVIGYPGTISKKKFKQDYCKSLDKTKAKKLWESVYNDAGFFECKIASEGKANVNIDDEYLSLHNCPCLSGTSGAPVKKPWKFAY